MLYQEKNEYISILKFMQTSLKWVVKMIHKKIIYPTILIYVNIKLWYYRTNMNLRFYIAHNII